MKQFSTHYKRWDTRIQEPHESFRHKGICDINGIRRIVLNEFTRGKGVTSRTLFNKRKLTSTVTSSMETNTLVIVVTVVTVTCLTSTLSHGLSRRLLS